MVKAQTHEAMGERCFRYLLRTKIKSNVSSLIAAQEAKKAKYPRLFGNLCNYVAKGERSQSLTPVD